MTCSRLCGPQRQPCPSPYLCTTDCNFQCAGLETPHDKAARHFWEPEQVLHIDVFAAKPLHLRAWDWFGNLPHRFGRWVDRSPIWRLFCAAVGFVVAGCLVSVWLVGTK